MNAKQRRFVQEFLVDSNAAAAARRAGYSERSARVNGPRLLSNAAVRQAIAERQEHTAQRLEIRREDVIAGLLDGIAMARMQADAGAVIRGWAEVGKLLGHYAPTRTAVAVTAFTAQLISKFEAMTDDELVNIIEGKKLN